jgi:ABC-type Zn uptake system ZnuABC Zn-binding protein ZnuA
MRNQSVLSCAIVGAALLLGATACGQKKIGECNQLIEVINKGVESLNKSPKGGADPTGAADLKSMADAMDKVAGDAAKVELTIPELKKYSAEYQTMAKDVAKAAREMAAAAEAKDLAKINSAQTALDKAVKQEDPLVDSINKFCQAP